jgi:hypothetical protein
MLMLANKKLEIWKMRSLSFERFSRRNFEPGSKKSSINFHYFTNLWLLHHTPFLKESHEKDCNLNAF